MIAFFKSMDILVTADLLSFRHSIWSVSNLVIWCFAAPGTPGVQCHFFVNISIIYDSHNFEKMR